jgi:small-conductance mechanosensitive channel
MNITRSVLILVGLLVSLSMVGVDLTALSVMGGAIGWAWASACRRSPPTM